MHQAGRRAKIVTADAMTEIQGMHAEATRVVSAKFGLGGRIKEAIKKGVGVA